MPKRRASVNVKRNIGGHTMFLTIGFTPEGKVGELFCDVGRKEDTILQTSMSTLAQSISVGLQHGVPLSIYIKMLRKVQCEPRDAESTSFFDFIAQELIAASGEPEPKFPSETVPYALT